MSVFGYISTSPADHTSSIIRFWEAAFPSNEPRVSLWTINKTFPAPSLAEILRPDCDIRSFLPLYGVLQIEHDVRLPSGRIAWLDTWVSDHPQSRKWHSGPYLSFDFKYEVIRRPHAAAQRRVVTSRGIHRRLRLTDVEWLFFQACGVLPHLPPLPELHHASFDLEDGWQSPAHSRMLFHRNIEALAQDFTTIYAYHHWGWTPATFPHDAAIWSLTDDERLRYNVTQPGYDLPPDKRPWREDTGLRQFLDAVDADTVQRLAALPWATFEHILRQAASRVPEVHIYQFGDRGVVLSCDPLHGTLWPLYAAIVDLARRQGFVGQNVR